MLSYLFFAVGVCASIWLFLIVSTFASSGSRFLDFIRREYPDYARRSNAAMLIRFVFRPDQGMMNHPVYGRLARTRPYLELRMLSREILKVGLIVIAAFAIGIIIKAVG